MIPVMGTLDKPVQLDPWQRIIEVNWGGAVMLVEIFGGEGAGGYHLRVLEGSEGAPPAGTSLWQGNKVDPPSAEPEDYPLPAGIKFERNSDVKMFRFIQTSISAEEVIIPGGDIVGWVADFDYGPPPEHDDTATTGRGIWDRCLDPDTGIYVGDPACEALLTGGAVPVGGVERHLRLSDILHLYGNSGDLFKRVHFSHQTTEVPGLTFDQRVYFADDRVDWVDETDSGLTEAQFDQALLKPYDKSLFRAERAITDGDTVTFPRQASWLVNFGFTARKEDGTPNPDGPIRPVTLAIDFEEPNPDGGSDGIQGAYIRLRRWSRARFEVRAATDGTTTVYIGTSSPQVDARITYGPLGISWDGNGLIATFNKDGFVA